MSKEETSPVPTKRPRKSAKASLVASNSAAEASLKESNDAAEADLKKSNLKAESLLGGFSTPVVLPLPPRYDVPPTKTKYDDTAALPAGFRWLFHIFAWGTLAIGGQFVLGDPDRFSASLYQVFFHLFGGTRFPGAVFVLLGILLLLAFKFGKWLLPVLWVTAGNYIFWAILFATSLFEEGDPPASSAITYAMLAAVPVAFVLTLRQWRRLQGKER